MAKTQLLNHYSAGLIPPETRPRVREPDSSQRRGSDSLKQQRNAIWGMFLTSEEML